MVEEGLADALEYLQSECESLARRGALISDEALFRHFVHKFGAPEDVAISYALETDGAVERDFESARLRDIGASAPSKGQSIRPTVVAVALTLTVVFAALGGIFVWKSRVSSSVGWQFTTYQGVPIFFPRGRESFADRVVSFRRGEPIEGVSMDPGAAIGIPDCPKEDYNEPEDSYVALGDGGELVVEFTDSALYDGDGPDVAIFEIGEQLESVNVAVSEDGQTWHELGIIRARAAAVDLARLELPDSQFRFVRLLDAKEGRSNGSNWPGADIDAIGAIHSSPFEPAP